MGKVIDRLLGKFGEQATKDNLERIKNNLPPIFEVPIDLMNPMMDYMLERSYLENISARGDFNKPSNEIIKSQIVWFKINRLPVSPDRVEDYDILSRWQSVLSSIHAWNNKLLFLLQRQNGGTNLYVGIQGVGTNLLATKCSSAFYSSMPGVDLKYLNAENEADSVDITRLYNQIYNSHSAGAVTGIPSFRKETQYGVFQTLDKLAFGMRGLNGIDVNFSFLVVAESIKDEGITDLISRFQNIGSAIHSEVTQHITKSQGANFSENVSTGVSIGGGIGLGSIAKTCLSLVGLGSNIGGGHSIGGGGVYVNANRNYGSSNGISFNESSAKDYLNKFAQYTESLTDKHCERLRAGRSLGFWNTGVYVLGGNNEDVNLVTGILRSIYSGDDTYIEPIRIHTLNSDSAIDHIKRFNLVPIANPQVVADNKIEWHTLGEKYQYLSTPVNTEELSLFTSLPRKDVPGLRFVKNAVRFANNPGQNLNQEVVNLGNIVDTGVEQTNKYKIDINALVRHSLIVGSTGCGKTTTCKTIINSVLDRNIPTLIIEPAKDEWVRWAIKQNEYLPDDKKLKIYEPGVTMFEDTMLSKLMLNPFQPAAFGNAEVDIQTRCEQITALINASLPTSDILPVVIDETLYAFLKENIEDFEEETIPQPKSYPLLEDALPVAKRILKNRGYEDRVTDSLSAAIDTRFQYLTRGKRGKILNNMISTSYDTLFNHNCVINLSKIPNAKDKALIMSILLLSLYEYRTSAYTNCKEYRNLAQANKLQHLTVIEEAHNVLSKPTGVMDGAGSPQQVVADLFSNMLSEIRSLGEGFMIIDQVPTKLIPDVIKNTNYKICHRMTSIDDCSVMAQSLALRQDQEGIIPTLEQGNIVISSDMDDAASWVKVSKPIINL